MFLTPASVPEVDRTQCPLGSNVHGCAQEKRAFDSFSKYFPCCIDPLGKFHDFFSLSEEKEIIMILNHRATGTITILCVYKGM